MSTTIPCPALSNLPLAFNDFDEETVFETAKEHFLKPDALNLVIEFDNSTARAAVDLNQEQIKAVLQAEQPEALPTKWISIWAPERQKGLVKAIGARYKFSPRLLRIMCDDPLKPIPAPVVPDTPRSRMHEMWHHQKEMEQTSRQSQASDPESVLEMANVESTGRTALDISHYNIINEVWHYSSVDWGHEYLCVGYNSLFNTHTGQEPRPAYTKQNHPEGKRLWTWLILCIDGTVISMHENPFPGHQGTSTATQKDQLKIIRKNTLNVFRQLSKANKVQSPIMTLGLRTGSESLESPPDSSPATVTSLLFLYLFDDWHTTYSLVARREHRYGEQLEQLRQSMFEKAKLDSIDRLHHIGRQLSILKRIYQSYTGIIESILVAQKPVHPTAEVSVTNSQVLDALTAAQREPHSHLDQSVTAAGNMSLGVALAPKAIVRFARLKERINLYALSEIQECLDEKESLVFLNFNLIALKESQAVERLTRITILLAKVTILFLPVSLLTAYFSVSSITQGYTKVTYWVAFAIIMTVSFLFLAAFGKLSGTVEGKPIYRSLSQIFYDRFLLAPLGAARRKGSKGGSGGG
ncbi:hypothetical protein LPUS_07476 [Lasallia pustulata]|uniref:Mg2+ transporter protein, CorA-like/Zinc transport protein ZntB n=1 Tax=Lasallia pustulata TaxID=136370 RepID=A0A1W5D3U5_9LECA|nr:hypothetical protein LPUS_07476 [Lasallia pustulata]